MLASSAARGGEGRVGAVSIRSYKYCNRQLTNYLWRSISGQNSAGEPRHHDAINRTEADQVLTELARGDEPLDLDNDSYF